MLSERLRVELPNFLLINDYRVHGGQVEVRTLNSVSHPFDLALSGWKPPDADDLHLHFALDSIVARWLQHRLPDVDNRATPGCCLM